MAMLATQAFWHMYRLHPGAIDAGPPAGPRRRLSLAPAKFATKTFRDEF